MTVLRHAVDVEHAGAKRSDTRTACIACIAYVRSWPFWLKDFVRELFVVPARPTLGPRWYPGVGREGCGAAVAATSPSDIASVLALPIGPADPSAGGSSQGSSEAQGVQ